MPDMTFITLRDEPEAVKRLIAKIETAIPAGEEATGQPVLLSLSEREWCAVYDVLRRAAPASQREEAPKDGPWELAGQPILTVSENGKRLLLEEERNNALEEALEAAKALLNECWRYEGECAVCTTTWDSERQAMEHEDGCYAEALSRALGGSPQNQEKP